MADESCGPTPTPSEAVKPGARMVHCVKFWKRNCQGWIVSPGKGNWGSASTKAVSKDAWKLWLEHSKMIMNEYRLNPLDPNSQKIMGEQMEQFSLAKAPKFAGRICRAKSKGLVPLVCHPAGRGMFDGQARRNLEC